jgi:uncharacterized protein (DUF302 family)
LHLSLPAIHLPVVTAAVAARAADFPEQANQQPCAVFTKREKMTELGFQTRLDQPYEAALERVTEALKAEGFGVLTQIDVKETMKKKLDVDFHKYAILGACNPSLAYKALTARPEIGLLLPCNVIVYEQDGQTTVSIVDPLSMFNFIQDPSLEPVVEEAHQRLQRVAQALQNQS